MATKAPAPLWDRIPKSYKWAVIPAVLGFIVKISFESSNTANGVQTSCTYFNLAGLVFAVVLVAMVVDGIRGNLRGNTRLRLAKPALFAAGAVYCAIAVLQVLLGLGVVGGPCA